MVLCRAVVPSSVFLIGVGMSIVVGIPIIVAIVIMMTRLWFRFNGEIILSWTNLRFLGRKGSNTRHPPMKFNLKKKKIPLVLLLVISLSLLSVHVSLDWRLELMLVLAFESGPIVGYVWKGRWTVPGASSTFPACLHAWCLLGATRIVGDDTQDPINL